MKRRRAVLVAAVGVFILATLGAVLPELVDKTFPHLNSGMSSQAPTGSAAEVLAQLAVKGRAPKTGYSRDQFGKGWGQTNGCDTRDIILYRDLQNPQLNGECTVIAGTLDDPYTGKTIQFTKSHSTAVQIDHVVALSDAWQKGAQQLTAARRKQLANDPLELLAVDGPTNQAKGDGDAATWLPSNKAFRCNYVARQIAVKKKYGLWVTDAEKRAMAGVLTKCSGQVLPNA
ncbi:MAG TPA: HNH endonuclease family protein [Dongiaceae bacterium]|nr:HNH endonuclease family protein [Dongiaceae bacterium]